MKFKKKWRIISLEATLLPSGCRFVFGRPNGTDVWHDHATNGLVFYSECGVWRLLRSVQLRVGGHRSLVGSKLWVGFHSRTRQLWCLVCVCVCVLLFSLDLGVGGNLGLFCACARRVRNSLTSAPIFFFVFFPDWNATGNTNKKRKRKGQRESQLFGGEGKSWS